MRKSLTEIIFLLDRSGSMGGLESDTIGGFNAFVEKQSKLEGETIVSTILFDDQYEILWNGKNAKELQLTDKEYFVRGMTALLDAVGKTIVEVSHRISNTVESERPDQVLFVITTDGLENASQEFTYQNIHQLITNQKEKHNWEFIFLGANIDVQKEAKRFGIDERDAFQYDASPRGLEKMYEVANQEISYRRGNL
ncbi:vWA domain-containing protein [Ornithinibacillus halophilus]|uniref:VWFA domain-containing protein n=1 Tax=Ornithinibacillus halophilus TaxID=930117 RepID=A0A1M5IJH4_9BACI|nr:vWA domain-containing protein [Ornithinibacillus halophilus]SHG28452.1 hypothetical protein SAMN05216225_102444 [Ornithinibacillus halophilus]